MSFVERFLRPSGCGLDSLRFCEACSEAGEGVPVIHSEVDCTEEERVEALELSGELGQELWGETGGVGGIRGKSVEVGGIRGRSAGVSAITLASGDTGTADRSCVNSAFFKT